MGAGATKNDKFALHARLAVFLRQLGRNFSGLLTASRYCTTGLDALDAWSDL